MPLTVRLGPKTERLLNAVAKRKQMSRSDVVREALAQYEAGLARSGPAASQYDAWMDVIGVVNLGVRDPARTTGEQFAAMIQERTRARRPR